MSTRSVIGMQQEDGTILAIYCHNDGYPEGVGAVLLEHYQSPDKIAALLALGDISSLGPELGEQHDFNEPAFVGPEMDRNPAYHTTWTKAYHRDRGEPWEDVGTKTLPVHEFFLFNEGGYHYIHGDGDWWVFKGDDFGSLLSDALAQAVQP